MVFERSLDEFPGLILYYKRFFRKEGYLLSPAEDMAQYAISLFGGEIVTVEDKEEFDEDAVY